MCSTSRSATPVWLMADARLRELERAEAAGNITREELEQTLCRYEGCQWVIFDRVDPNGLPGNIELLICRRCLTPKIEWNRPILISRCEICRSPVLMRKAGVCLDCGIILTMPKDTPPKPGHVMMGRTASGTMTHGAMRLPKAGSRTRVKSLCGPNLMDDSLEVGRPTCRTCLNRLRAARVRQREAEGRDFNTE